MVTEPSAVIPCDEAPDVPDDVRRSLFRCVLVHRLFEERIIALYRQGRIPGSVYTGRGQEAVGAGAGLALGPDDVVAPLNRELSCHLARGVPVGARVPQLPRPRDRPHAGPRRQHALRRARARRLPARLDARRPGARHGRRGAGRSSAAASRSVALTFFGDGAFNCGDTHEGLNLAGALNVPAVFIAQSNRVAYSTVIGEGDAQPEPVGAHRGRLLDPVRPGRRHRRARGATARCAPSAGRARSGEGPQAVEALSLRIDGHAAHDDGRYMDRALIEEFVTKRDPVERLAARLLADGMSADELGRAARRPQWPRSRPASPRPSRRRRPIRPRCSTASTRRRCAPGAERRAWPSSTT